jgi:hypothetical protein
MKRRPTATEDQTNAFIDRVTGLMEQYPLDRIVSIDETNWRTVAAGFLIWAVKRAGLPMTTSLMSPC